MVAYILVFNEWSKLPTAAILNKLDDFFELKIARSRKHIETYYETDDIGKFPDSSQ